MLLVLCYHDIDPSECNPWVLHPDKFREQLISVREMGYEIISIDDIDDTCHTNRKLAVVTFDDGRAGCYTHAVPVLRELNCPATFFVCLDFTRGEAPAHERYTEFMPTSEIRRLSDAGYTIGAHSVTHRSFDTLDLQTIYVEIQTSMNWVQTVTGRPCHNFALPYGDGGMAAAGIAKACGARRCLFTGNQLNGNTANLTLLKRVCVESGTDIDLFKTELTKMVPANAPPEFSFIIPVKGDDPTLVDTIKSIRKLGDRSTVEIVVVYDGNVPSYIRDVDVMAETHYTQSDGSGVAAARNTGAALARGNVLVFTDAHVCFSANFLDELRRVDVAAGDGIRGCTTQLVRDYATFRSIADSDRLPPTERQQGGYYGWKVVIKNGELTTDIVTECARDGWFRVPYVGACTLAISKGLFAELGGFDRGLVGAGSMEDCELAIRCWLSGRDVRVTSKAVCWHLSDGAIPPKSKYNPHAAIDDPRYPGETLNTVRLLGLHYPASVAVAVVDRFNKLCRQRNTTDCREAYGAALLEAATSNRNLLMTPQRLVAVMAGEGLER